MPNTLRVLLSPVPAPLLAERNAVGGVEVALASFGKLGSAASQSPAPAKLRFHARYISRVRKEQASAWQPFATLSGRIVLRGPGLKPVFLNDTEAGAGRSMLYEHPLDSDDAVSGPADGKPRLVLKLGRGGRADDPARPRLLRRRQRQHRREPVRRAHDWGIVSRSPSGAPSCAALSCCAHLKDGTDAYSHYLFGRGAPFFVLVLL